MQYCVPCLFVCFPNMNNYLSYVYDVLTLVYRVIRWIVTNISQKRYGLYRMWSSQGGKHPHGGCTGLLRPQTAYSIVWCHTAEKHGINNIFSRFGNEKLKKRTGSRIPAKSVSASVLDTTNSVLDSGNESSSSHICGFAHSLKANILIIPAPYATQTLIHTECYAEASMTSTATINE